MLTVWGRRRDRPHADLAITIALGMQLMLLALFRMTYDDSQITNSMILAWALAIGLSLWGESTKNVPVGNVASTLALAIQITLLGIVTVDISKSLMLKLNMLG